MTAPTNGGQGSPRLQYLAKGTDRQAVRALESLVNEDETACEVSWADKRAEL